MKIITLLLLLFAMITIPTSAQDTEANLERYKFTHDDRERTYWVYTPTDYDDSKSYTLLIALHPANTAAQAMVQMTNFQSLADANDVLMVFPNSVSGRWNSSGTLAPDDVGFISALLDTIIADYAVDESGVFVLGYSSGGLMTMKLRCALADRLKGVISYAAPLTFSIADDCLSAPPLSAMVIHGTADEVFPYSGQATVTADEISGTLSLDQTIGVLAGLNDCESQAQTEDISSENAPNRAFVKGYTCDDLVTELYTIVGLGHFGWAGTFPLNIDDEDMTLNQAIFRFMTRVRDLR